MTELIRLEAEGLAAARKPPLKTVTGPQETGKLRPTGPAWPSDLRP